MTTPENTKPATRYWRSIEELEGSPAYAEALAKEFPDGAETLDGVDRRRFMQVMGASVALAGASSCRWEKTELLPFKERPAGRVPGIPEHYATCMELGGVAQPLLLTAYEGRPIKVEGNAQHPESGGATSVYAQAAPLELYDPDRSQAPLENGVEVAWTRAEEQLAAALDTARANGGAGFAVLAQPSSSPALARMKRLVGEALPQATWTEYAPVDRTNEREGSRLAFGEVLRTHYRLGGAKVVAAFDSDLFHTHPAALRHQRDFAHGRDPHRDPQVALNRLYAVESAFSTVGSSADHRLPLRSAQVAAFLAALEAKLVEKGLAIPGGWGRANAAPDAEFLAAGKPARVLDALADDLLANRGASAIAVGPRQGPGVHALAHRLNAALGNVGETVLYSRVEGDDRGDGRAALEELVGRMRGGEVGTLLVLGGNPVYDAPRDLGFGEALAAVETSIHLSLYADETSAAATWHVPAAHWLETWGDALAWDGSHCVAQPLIRPLYEGRNALELLARAAGEAPDPQALVRAAFDEGPGDSSDAAWRRALHDGVRAGSESTPVTPSPRAVAPLELDRAALSAGVPASGELELVLLPDPKVYDGRFANSGWLQELPDYLTKLTWDNAALVSPATAKALGIGQGDLVTLSVGGRDATCAVYVMPGQAAGSIALALGYGRTRAGHVGGLADEDVPSVGFDPYEVFAGDADAVRGGLSVAKAGGSYVFALTADHHMIDTTGRKTREERIDELVKHRTVAEYEAETHGGHADGHGADGHGDEGHGDAAHHGAIGDVHGPPLESLWTERSYDDKKWGMAIDLTSCTGCNACVVACQSENNIPVVGKEQVRNGREMHWLRIDRYFETGDGPDAGHDVLAPTVDDPVVHSQAVACIQCETAPCEQVCPVAATVHSDEGLNDMVYNRCIGTRYCSNNCPVKVRRFNFFNYHKDLRKDENASKKLVYNPEVTVRSRGVMEKCTYCVQRIQTAKIRARVEKREMRDGDVVTACQQVCPTDAISFGDLNLEGSEVAAKHESDRAYKLLAYLNIKPRTAYLARITNPNPALEAAAKEA